MAQARAKRKTARQPRRGRPKAARASGKGAEPRQKGREGRGKASTPKRARKPPEAAPKLAVTWGVVVNEIPSHTPRPSRRKYTTPEERLAALRRRRQADDARRKAERAERAAMAPKARAKPPLPTVVEPLGPLDREGVKIVLGCLDARVGRGIKAGDVRGLGLAYGMRLRRFGMKSADAEASLRMRLAWRLQTGLAGRSLADGIRRAYCAEEP